MVYRIIGLMSGSSLDGLDIAFVEFTETAGAWDFEIPHAACMPYPEAWKQKLSAATTLSARDYLLLDAEYGQYTAMLVNDFISTHALEHRVQLIASHGHTSFHIPEKGMTAQLGNPAAIAAKTGIRVIGDLRSGDVALGGQGAPLVPIGEKLLFGQYALFLNIGGIANISARDADFRGFDICPANRVLNMLAADLTGGYDEDGRMAASGVVDWPLLERLNAFSYYRQDPPKSLANRFGVEEIFPVISEAGLSTADALRTYVEHICVQVKNSIQWLFGNEAVPGAMLVTGGGACNLFLVTRLQEMLGSIPVELVIPDRQIIDYKEALIIALIGALRWREDVNTLQAVTGASRDHTGGAIWCG